MVSVRSIYNQVVLKSEGLDSASPAGKCALQTKKAGGDRNRELLHFKMKARCHRI